MIPRGRIALSKKLSIVQTARRLRELIVSYVDEVTKEDIASGFSDETFAKLKDLPIRQRYRCFGEVDDAMSVAVPGRELDSLAEWWATRTGHLKRKAFHHTFALQPDFAAQLEKAGVPVGDALFDCVSRSYASFAAQFYGEDELGYVVGIHRERSHPHAHVLILPFTRKGRRLNFSRLAPVVLDGREVRIDFQGYLQERFTQEVENYRQMLVERAGVEKKKPVAERLLFANLIFVTATRAEKAKPEIPFEALLEASAGEALKSSDLSGSLIEQRSAAIKRVQEERDGVVLRGGLPAAAQMLQQRARTLRTQFADAVLARETNDVLALRAARLTARMLEIVGAVSNRLPPHLLRPVDTKAVRSGALNKEVEATQIQAVVDRERQRYALSNRIQPLGSLINQPLGPSSLPAEAEAFDSDARTDLKTERVTASGVPDPILAPDPTVDWQAALQEVERRARDLTENAKSEVTLNR